MNDNPISYLDHPEVFLIDHMGGDESVVRSARVSVKGRADAVDMTDPKSTGLISYLMENKHGTPFEHNAMTFYVKAPIFVFREFHRHRIGLSYNEMSGRYMELPPEFYSPAPGRPLFNKGTSARPDYTLGEQVIAEDLVNTKTIEIYEAAWRAYQDMLSEGIAPEVARIVLPVGIMSQMYVTCNARSLMSFLSLRTHEPEAQHVSHPQHEIQQVARAMEEEFANLFPVTYAAYNKFRRVAP